MGYQGFFEILMITLISSKKLGVCNNMRYTVYVINKEMWAKNPRFIIKNSFKSRAGYNCLRTVSPREIIAKLTIFQAPSIDSSYSRVYADF